jgi:hypothetical protein
MTKHDQRHGGPYDRGTADAWYHRPPNPHYYRGGSRTSGRVAESDMTAAEVAAYLAGYAAGDDTGGKDYE